MDRTKAKINKEGVAKLGKKLAQRFDTYATDRRAAEKQWLTNLRQFNGVHDPDTTFASGQSKAYPKITRVKVVSMVSRLMSLLFPSGEKNWGLTRSPTPSFDEATTRVLLERFMSENPGVPFDAATFQQAMLGYATEAAMQLEQYIDDQLGDMGAHGPVDYATIVKKVVRSGVLFGVGVLKGPMTLSEAHAEITIAEDGSPMVGTTTAYRPYFEFVPCWDYYPDMTAKSPEQQDGAFVRHVFSRHQLNDLAGRDDFMGDVIRAYLQKKQDGNYQQRDHERQLAGRDEEYQPAPTGKFEVLEYWGHVSGHDLRAAGVDVSDDKLSSDITANVWLLDGKVIKAEESQLPEDFRMYHTFLFEEDDVRPTGVGLPEIMRDSQLAVGAATRMLLDNAAVVCGPNAEVDVDLLVSGQDYTFAPFKTWMKRGDAGGGRAVQPVTFDAHITELLATVRLFMDFADTETFVGPATGGDSAQLPSEAMRTTGGASMVMGSAALPFRDVVRNFDRFTVSVINSLVRWNELFNLSVETIGDMRPVGRGATSLMAKEVRAYSLDNLANTMLEEERDYINMEALAKHRLATRDLPLNELMVDKETAQRNRDMRVQQQTEAGDQMRQRFEEELRNLRADTFRLLSAGKKNLDGVDVDLFRAVVEAMEKGQDVSSAIGAGDAVGRAGGDQAQQRDQAGAEAAAYQAAG